ncbi:TadE-like protein [Propionicimonas paludicola]|uniref:TadE-like protein n=1 Tax=Propionicimonas paludicola TaxID=185243 RepID=A0A2A9CXD1_9ACTN|nr:TadE-like protein [Propionicimonas paludicola]
MNQRGVAESVQWAILMPALLMLILGLVQTGIWLHGRAVAAAAAATIADLRAPGDDPAAAEEAGRRVATTGGLTEVGIDIAVDRDLLVVTVTGRPLSFLDFGLTQIRERAVLPAEVAR